MAEAPRPSVKELARMNIPMAGPPPGPMGGPRIVTPRTSLSGSFAPVTNRTASGNFPLPNPTGSSDSGGSPVSTGSTGSIASRLQGLNIPMGAPGMGPPRILTPSATAGSPTVTGSPGSISSRLQGLNIPMGAPGMGSPRIITPSATAGFPTVSKLSQEEIDQQQQDIGATTRRRPSVRRNSRMNRTQFENIDVDVSSYLEALNQSTPRGSISGSSLPVFCEPPTTSEETTTTPTLPLTEEIQTDLTHTEETTPRDDASLLEETFLPITTLPMTIEEEWEIVDPNSPTDAIPEEDPPTDVDGGIAAYLSTLIANTIQYGLSTII